MRLTELYYSCPKCSSKKKPRMVRYFPPIAVKCFDCGYTNIESKFIYQKENKSVQLNYSH